MDPWRRQSGGCDDEGIAKPSTEAILKGVIDGKKELGGFALYRGHTGHAKKKRIASVGITAVAERK